MLIAPPERDLWLVAAGDDSTVDDYAAATGAGRTLDDGALPAAVGPRRPRRQRRRCRRPHTGNADDLEGWEILHSIVTRI